MKLSRQIRPIILLSTAVLLTLLINNPSVAATTKKAVKPTVTTTLSYPCDYKLSPYTGYTQAHWLEITEKIIAGVMPHLSAETGLWTLPELNDSIAFKKVYSQYKYLDSYRRIVERMMIASVFYTAATGKDEYSSRVNGI